MQIHILTNTIEYTVQLNTHTINEYTGDEWNIKFVSKKFKWNWYTIEQ